MLGIPVFDLEQLENIDLKEQRLSDFRGNQELKHWNVGGRRRGGRKDKYLSSLQSFYHMKTDLASFS